MASHPSHSKNGEYSGQYLDFLPALFHKIQFFLLFGSKEVSKVSEVSAKKIYFLKPFRINSFLILLLNFFFLASVNLYQYIHCSDPKKSTLKMICTRIYVIVQTMAQYFLYTCLHRNFNRPNFFYFPKFKSVQNFNWAKFLW